MSEAETEHVFFSSKPRVIHMAVNIALAPVLLYLVGLWPWPPTLPHYVTFFITGLIGMRYAKQRLGAPRLGLDEKGLYCGEFYPAENIRNAERVMRALKLTLMEDGQVREKIISLGWASNADFTRIVELVTGRFGKPSK
ncbi:MAG: hypothetical protein QNJ85_07245 [Gammaproteobacteria bacterium]|nr:hypothetical protein [Gammaproteobacteria bacterium]